MEPLSIDQAFESLEESWTPQIIAAVGTHHVKIARLEGDFVWHSHADADELFLVHSGSISIEFRDEPDAQVDEGELLVVPAGVEHRPVAEEPAEVILIEQEGTENTGDAEAPSRDVDVDWIEGELEKAGPEE